MPTLLLLVACLTPKSTTDDTTGGDDSGTATDDTGTPPGGETHTIFEVNDGTVAPDSTVTLERVVITSPITRDGEGFFVADPAGGPGSGLYVWGPNELADMTITQGDEVTISGTVSDYYGWLELELQTYEVTGEAEAPAAVDLGDGAGVDWGAYESVLVTVTDQDITALDAYNTATLSSGVLLDDGFVLLDHDCGGHYDSVTGIVFYRYEAWSINPRTTDDLVGYTGSDTSSEATCADVQAGAVCGDAILTDVVVTGEDFGDPGTATFFVQDAGGGGGVAVFVSASDYDVSVGDVLTLTGSATEFYDFTEVRVDDVTQIQKTGTADPVPTTLDAAPADWEPYEGMLVTLSDVTTSGEANYGEIATDWSIYLDDLYYDAAASDGDHFASVTGVVYYSYDEWKIEPRSEADVVR